jgi:hypothetical protein
MRAMRGGQGAEASVFRDEPRARALYGKMIEALRQPQSLSYWSEYRWQARGAELGRCSYTVWLRKPEDILLKPGTPAPDFELFQADGDKVKLSDFRDKIVWFYIWRAG